MALYCDSPVPVSQPPDATITSMAAWCNLDWTVLGTGEPQSIKTIVTTCSDYSLIQYREARRRGLAIRPLVESEYELKDVNGGRERITQFTEIELECPIIGLERVKFVVLIVRCEQIVGLVVGSQVIDEHTITEKIRAAVRQHGQFPPGTSIDFMANRGNIAFPIFDCGSKGTRFLPLRRQNTPADRITVVEKKGQEDHKQGETLAVTISILQAKA